MMSVTSTRAATNKNAFIMNTFYNKGTHGIRGAELTKKTRKTRGVNSVGGLNPPPKETRWKKGCPSPNPKGRPHKTEITDVVREVLERENPKTHRTELETIVENWVRRTKQGDTKKGEILFAYRFGRPKQSLEGGGEGSPLVVKIVHVGNGQVSNS